MVMGTPHYMSPEQVRGAKADARSDVFSLGCVFYEMLTGRKPFDAESMHAVLFKVMQEDPPPARELAPGTPEAVLQILETALAKNPADRFQNAGEMLEALRQARQAIAAGRGNERAAVRERTEHSTAAAAALARRPAGGERSQSVSASRRTKPPARRSASRWLLAGLALGLVVVIVAAAWGLRTYVLGPTAEPSSHPAEVRTLAQAVIDNAVELARRRLDAGDLADAARQAERALKLDPANEPARRVLEEAGAGMKRLDAATAALHTATASGAADRIAAAAFELMKLDPANPEAERAAAGPAFRPRVDEARRLAQQAREAASAAGGERSPAFAEASALQARGEQAAQAGQAPLAARSYLEARSRFERAGHPAR